MLKVLELVVIPPYGPCVRFNNEQAWRPDCAKLLLEPGPMIEPFRDPAFFARISGVWRSDLAGRPRHVAEWLRRKMLAAGELSASAA